MFKPGDPIIHNDEEGTVIEEKADSVTILTDTEEKDVPSFEVTPDWSKR